MALGKEAVSAFAHDGYWRQPCALPPEAVRLLQPVITKAVRSWTPEQFLARLEADCGPGVAAGFAQHFAKSNDRPRSRTVESGNEGAGDTYARAFTQRMNLWRDNELIARLVLARRLGRLAAELLGVQAVRIYHDQALYKEAGGGHTPWHADQFYWPLASDRTVTAWIPLQAVSAAMGPLAFAKGSHRVARELSGELAISDASEREIGAAVEGLPVDDRPFELGEVSFHGGWTCHRAGANSTRHTRAAFTIIYMDADMRMLEPQHQNHRADAALWLPGVKPGAPAASPINPLVG
ncbi:MAG: phytanoyl-CoA dioxygenase family protein [Pseudomonadota bacterium]